jgi:hypothetical protein
VGAFTWGLKVATRGMIVPKINNCTENSVNDPGPVHIFFCVGRSGNETGSSPSTSVVLNWYHSTSAQYRFYPNMYSSSRQIGQTWNLQTLLFGNLGSTGQKNTFTFCLTYFDSKGGLSLFCLFTRLLLMGQCL